MDENDDSAVAVMTGSDARWVKNVRHWVSESGVEVMNDR